jgi:hypothetical protein
VGAKADQEQTFAEGGQEQRNRVKADPLPPRPPQDQQRREEQKPRPKHEKEESFGAARAEEATEEDHRQKLGSGISGSCGNQARQL